MCYPNSVSTRDRICGFGRIIILAYTKICLYIIQFKLHLFFFFCFFSYFFSIRKEKEKKIFLITPKHSPAFSSPC